MSADVTRAGAILGSDPGPNVAVQEAEKCQRLPGCVGDDELGPWYHGLRSRGLEGRHGRADDGW
jgi:hypothetical protein